MIIYHRDKFAGTSVFKCICGASEPKKELVSGKFFKYISVPHCHIMRV